MVDIRKMNLLSKEEWQQRVGNMNEEENRQFSLQLALRLLESQAAILASLFVARVPTEDEYLTLCALAEMFNTRAQQIVPCLGVPNK